MTRPVTAIRNLGPASAREFAKIGITTAEQLEELGADEAYRQWLKSGRRPHFIGYYVLVMGLQGRPWNDCRGAEKAELRVRFDALVVSAQDKQLGQFERILDEIGVVSRR